MKTTACDEVRGLLSEHLDGELDAGAEARVRAHLGGCPACTAQLELLRRTVGALRAEPDLPAPAAILAGVRAQLHPVPWYRRILEGRQWLLGVPVGAVATVLVVVGVALFQARYPGMRKAEVPTPPPRQDAAPSREMPAAAPPRAPAPVPAPAAPAPVTAPAPVAPPAALPPAPVPQPAPASRMASEAPAPTQPAPRLADTAAPQEASAPAPPPRQAVKERADGMATAPAPAPAQPLAKTAGAPTAPVAIDDRAPAAGRAASDAGGAVDRGTTRPVGQELAAAPAPLEKKVAAAREPLVAAAPAPPQPQQTAVEERARDTSHFQVPEPETAPQPGKPRRFFEVSSPQRDEATGFRVAGSPAAGSGPAPPGAVSLRAPARANGALPSARSLESEPAAVESLRREEPATWPEAVVLLLPAGGDLDEVKQVIRRDGGRVLVTRVLDPREQRERLGTQRGRRAAEITRGWDLVVRAPRQSLRAMADALERRPGVLVLERRNSPPVRGRAPDQAELRLTVYR